MGKICLLNEKVKRMLNVKAISNNQMCLYSINAPCVVVQIQDFIFILCMYAPYRFFFVKYFLKSEFQNSWYHHYILKRRGDQKVPAIYMYMYGKLFCWSNFITEEKSLVSWDIYYVRVDGDPIRILILVILNSYLMIVATLA